MRPISFRSASVNLEEAGNTLTFALVLGGLPAVEGAFPLVPYFLLPEAVACTGYVLCKYFHPVPM